MNRNSLPLTWKSFVINNWFTMQVNVEGIPMQALQKKKQ